MKKLSLIFTLLVSTVIFSSPSYSEISVDDRYPLVDTCPNSPSKKVNIVGKWSNCIGTYILKDESTLQGPFSSGTLNGNFFFTTPKGLVGLQEFKNNNKVGELKLLGKASFLSQRASKKTTSQKTTSQKSGGRKKYLNSWSPRGKFGIKFGMTYKDVVQQTEHVKGCSKSAYRLLGVEEVIGNFRKTYCSLTSRHGNRKISLLMDHKVDPSSKVVGLIRRLDSFNFSSWAKYHNILKKKYKLIKEHTRVDQEKFSRNDSLIINSYQNNRLKEQPKYIQLIGRNRSVATNGFVYDGYVSVYYYSISAGKKIMQKYNRNKKLDDDL